jgi:hypothetical protein
MAQVLDNNMPIIMNTSTVQRIRLHGKLLQAIANMREAKNEKDTIGESAIGFIEVSKTVNDVYEMYKTRNENTTIRS